MRRLINHLLFWAPSLEGAARKTPVVPPGASEQDVDLCVGDWATTLETHIDRVATAWSEPAAWEGATRMGGPEEVPASMIGGMVCTELVVHGWDLARATDQKPHWDDPVAEFAYGELAATAAQGRAMGLYGPEVTVPDTAPWLERALGLSGRDPDWRP